jgi:hypothetical protein
MNTMTTELDNDRYDAANEAVLFCLTFLSEREEHTAASCIEGIDAIIDQRTGRIAYNRLLAAHRCTRDVAAKYTLSTAMHTVERALHVQALLAAS